MHFSDDNDTVFEPSQECDVVFDAHRHGEHAANGDGMTGVAAVCWVVDDFYDDSLVKEPKVWLKRVPGRELPSWLVADVVEYVMYLDETK